jgi:hypothetical protein
MECPYCHARMILKDSSVVYGKGKSYGPIYVCANYPRCDAYVGTHKAGHMKGQPLGTPANAELRNARKLLHAKFDPIWKDGHVHRRKAYKLLAELMKIDAQDCHIAMFDIQRCREAWRAAVLLRSTVIKGSLGGAAESAEAP